MSSTFGIVTLVGSEKITNAYENVDFNWVGFYLKKNNLRNCDEKQIWFQINPRKLINSGRLGGFMLF